MLKFIKYVNERGGTAILPAFTATVNFKSVQNMFGRAKHTVHFSQHQ
jgi:hypothetical protein